MQLDIHRENTVKWHDVTLIRIANIRTPSPPIIYKCLILWETTWHLGLQPVHSDTSGIHFLDNSQMNNKMPTQTGLLKRANSYYFQTRIPLDCLDHYPKAILRENLYTLDKNLAKRLVAQRWALLYEEFDRIRTTGTKSKTTLTPDDVKRVIASAISSRLTADDEMRLAGLSDDLFDSMTEWHDEAEARERRVIARGQIDQHTKDVAAEWLSVEGFDIAEDSKEFSMFVHEFVRAQTATTKAFKARHEGTPIDTDKVLHELPKVSSAGSVSDAPLLSKVVGYFLENYDSSKPMYRKHKSFLPRFAAYLGDRPVDQIRQVDINEFAKLLCKLPTRWIDIIRKTGQTIEELAALEHTQLVAPKTFEDTYIASLRPFLKSSKRVFGDSGFPLNLTTDGLEYRGLRKSGDRKQRAFTSAELKRLFEGAEISAFAESSDNHHKYWLPLIVTCSHN